MKNALVYVLRWAPASMPSVTSPPHLWPHLWPHLCPSLPAGPRGVIRQTLSVLRAPHQYDRRNADRYGDPFTTKIAHGTYVVTGRPELVQAIFSADPDNFDSGAAAALAPLVGDGSLLLLSGKSHRRARRLIMPPFHGARMRAYGRLIQDVALRHASRWPTDRPFDVEQTSRAISLEIILRAVFGLAEPRRIEEHADALARYVDLFTPALMSFPPLRKSLFGLGPWARFTAAREAVDRLVFQEIHARRRSSSPGEDILSLLLAVRDDQGEALSDDELRDQLITLLFAGHETTATAVAWAFYWISRSPRVRACVTDEIEALGPLPDFEALAGSTYLGAVCDETLRLYPIVPDIPRRLRRPFRLGDHTLPAGVMVCASTAIAHARPETFPDPDEFRPERFLRSSFSPFEYFPFGGGHRRCIGAAFSLYEMKIVLGTLLARHKLSLAEPHPVRSTRRNVTTGPDGGIHLIHAEPPSL